MSVVFQTGSMLPRLRTFALYSMVWALVAFLPVSAQAFEVTTTTQSGVVAPMARAPSDPSGDSCLYILRAARDRSEVTSRHNEYRQAAGSAAAIGLVFGVRFALGPSEVTKVRSRRAQPVAAFGVWEPRESTNGGQALAIADYRACRNENALRALTD